MSAIVPPGFWYDATTVRVCGTPSCLRSDMFEYVSWAIVGEVEKLKRIDLPSSPVYKNIFPICGWGAIWLCHSRWDME